jgi:transcriptional regulator with XRE-family HTH domain
MVITQQVRHCSRCGTRLARDNTDTRCAACSRAVRDELSKPPFVAPEFWEIDQMRDALSTWHMGRVIFAYRTNPYRGKPLTQEMVAHWLGLTQAQLSRLENGKPPEELSKLINYARALRIPAHLLWFKLPEQREALSESVDPREFIGARTALATVGPTQGVCFLASLSHVPIPDEVQQYDIEQGRSAARTFTSWDHAYGGAIVREAVTAQLRWSAHLLEAKCPERLRTGLFISVGYLGGVCGFMAFDAYAHDDARRMFAFALSCAEAAGDWHLRAKLLSHMARQAIWCCSPDNGLTFTELALVRADRLTGTERAMLHTARARALAKLGRVQDTLSAVGEADEAFGDSKPSEDPPWMAYYDHAQHCGDTGHALFDLAIDGHSEPAAAQRLAEAVNGHSDAYARSRAISGTKLATLTMTQGDPCEAAVIGHRAIDDAGRLRSRRAVDDLCELRNFASARAASPDVAELCERITGLVGTT